MTTKRTRAAREKPALRGSLRLPTIPFKLAFREKIDAGEKTMTSRNRVCGKPGDHLQTPWGTRLELLEVRPEFLEIVASVYFREEGCVSPDEFVDIWKSIYRSYSPSKEVYLHRFRVVVVGPNPEVGK